MGLASKKAHKGSRSADMVLLYLLPSRNPPACVLLSSWAILAGLNDDHSEVDAIQRGDISIPCYCSKGMSRRKWDLIAVYGPADQFVQELDNKIIGSNVPIVNFQSYLGVHEKKPDNINQRLIVFLT